MTSIQSIGHPLVYKAKLPPEAQVKRANAPDTVAVRAEIRALEGMQKEAIVHDGDTVWRMVSDEGPYLNGTDLAPFPLAFYTAGMAFSFLSELIKHAQNAGIAIRSVTIVQDNFYMMEGSALRGDMIGGAKPAEIAVEIDSDADDAQIVGLLARAEATSPAQAYMRDPLTNTFSLCLNGQRLDVQRVQASSDPLHDDPTPKFEQIAPQSDETFAPEIITKLETAQQVFGVEGGAGSSLQSEQKRTLHVRGITSLRDDGLMETKVQLFKPIGSTFRFLCDDGRDERAPKPLAYLTAGVGFCYMTQLGRFAHIKQYDLTSYRIVQENIYKLASAQADSRASTEPVDTQVFVTFDEPEEVARQLVSMGERTCFLHAAMRSSVPSIIRVGGDE
jgi:uncharacterized OsmC-like protein